MNTNVKRWAGAACMLVLAVSAQAGKYTFKVANPVDGAKLTLTWNADGTQKTIDLVNGEGSIEVNDFQPQYVTLKYGRSGRTLYLDPAKDLNVSFDGKTLYKQIDFAGEGVDVNNYLNHTKFAVSAFNDAKKQEAAFLQSMDSVYQANIALLEKAQVPADFAKQEKERLKYTSYAMLPMYPSYYKYLNKVEEFTPSDAFYAKLNDIAPVDASRMAYSEYKEFIVNVVLANAFRKGDTDSNQRFIEYVSANVKDEKVLEHVANTYIYDKVNNSGVDGAGKLIEFYHRHVKDAALTKRFDELCAKWETIKAGQPSPTFSCPDINGKMVSLADLRGKYVYIDVWATWCGPCRGELPHLKKLEEAYAGKDIEFVSLSCDRDKAAWEKMVKGEELKGIQLHMGTDDPFMDKYIISGIPRFILLDREGRIVKADASRPSNPDTAKLFDQLLAK